MDHAQQIWKTVEAAQTEMNGNPYRHYKGGTVRVITLALEEETLEPIVVYVHSSLIFTRPLKEWSEPVTDAEGRSVNRFTKMETTPKTRARIVEADHDVFVFVEGGKSDGCQVPISTRMPEGAFTSIEGEAYRKHGNKLIHDEAETVRQRKVFG